MTFSLCDWQTAVSKSARDFHCAKIAAPPNGTPVIHNGIEPPDPLTEDEIRELRAEWGIEDCSRVIGIHNCKIDTIVAAFKKC